MHPWRMVSALHMQASARARPLMLALRMQAVAKACEFLLGVQRPDGGWGESYLSCQDKVHPAAIFSDPLFYLCTWLLLACRPQQWWQPDRQCVFVDGMSVYFTCVELSGPVRHCRCTRSWKATPATW